MLVRLARLAHGHPRRVLAVAVLGLALAGTWGGGVADRLEPYGADDPASASIRANERLAEATGLQPGAAVVAVVATGPVDRPADAA